MNISIFVSGNGSNCENIIRYFQHSSIAKVSLVLCNKSDAPALSRARALGVDTVVMNKAEFNDANLLMPILRKYQIDFVVLAGFLLIVPDFLLQAFHQRMINIHPSLLPKYGGKGMYGHYVHEAVFQAREQETGMTVHWVSEQCDGGEIIAQYRVSLLPTDTPDIIAQKEHELEMKYFPLVIERLVHSLG